MTKGCCGDCIELARKQFETARKFGLLAEIIYHYRLERKNGRCPCVAAWRACYEWDI